MTPPSTVREAIERVPGWEGEEVGTRALPGGTRNRSWLVDAPDGRFVLRLGGEAPAVGVDASRELRVHHAAHDAGIAPAIRFADPGAGVLVTAYVDARRWHADDLECPQNVRSVANLLRRVHALPPAGAMFEAADYARTYESGLTLHAELRKDAALCASIVTSAPPPVSIRCCHNDVVAANLLGDSPQLIDWEYAADNDPYFDLASLIGYHDLPDSTANSLLAEYSGSTTAGHREQLSERRRVYDALQWLWLANRIADAPRAADADRLAAIRARLR